MRKQHLEIFDTGGLWRRSWLRTPDSEDNSTCVLWMQGKQLHVDMRLPAAANELKHAPSLSALNADQLRLLARAEGFAGRTTVKDSVCTWTRHINLQGPLKGIDTGRLRWTPDGLLESGIHTQYQELWQRVDSVVPQARVMTNSHGQTLIILWTTTRFALGHGWHERTIHTRSLPEHVAYALACFNKAILARAFDQEFCVGRIEGEHGIIEHSTQPMRCGALAFDAKPLYSNARRLEVLTSDFYGQTSCEEYRVPARSPAMA